MASIRFEVTDKPQSVARLNTEQTFEARVISKFDKPPVTANRTYAAAMDHKSGRGTKIATFETFTMKVLFMDDEIAAIDELLYSLMDWQRATLLGTDIPKLGTDRDFILMDESWSFDTAGCSGNYLQFSGKLL